MTKTKKAKQKSQSNQQPVLGKDKQHQQAFNQTHKEKKRENPHK